MHRLHKRNSRRACKVEGGRPLSRYITIQLPGSAARKAEERRAARSSGYKEREWPLSLSAQKKGGAKTRKRARGHKRELLKSRVSPQRAFYTLAGCCAKKRTIEGWYLRFGWPFQIKTLFNCTSGGASTTPPVIAISLRLAAPQLPPESLIFSYFLWWQRRVKRVANAVSQLLNNFTISAFLSICGIYFSSIQTSTLLAACHAMNLVVC